MRARQLNPVVLLVMTGIVACSGKISEIDSSGGEGGGESGGEGGDEGGGSDEGGGDGDDGGDDDTPVAALDDAFCTVHVTGDTRAVWTVLATASDPQGADTLELVVDDGVVLMQGGSEVARYALNCVVADLSRADCSGTFSAPGDGTSCDDAPTYAVMVEAVDEDGNRGASSSLTGRVE